MTALALDALDRLDFGGATLADREAAEQHDRRLQLAAAVADERDHEYVFTAWLADQCPICEEGGGALVCDDHVIEMETWMKRVLDV